VSGPTPALSTLPPEATDAGLPQLVKIREVSSALRLSIPTIYSLIHRGRLPVVRFGSAVRVRVEDVRALVEGRR